MFRRLQYFIYHKSLEKNKKKNKQVRAPLTVCFLSSLEHGLCRTTGYILSGTASYGGILLPLPRLSMWSGSLLVLVTFPVFSCHLRHCQELRLTFEVPSGGPSDEQPRSLPDLSRAQPPPSSLPKRLVSSRLHRDALTHRTCRRPQIPGELTGLGRLFLVRRTAVSANRTAA